MNITKTCSSYEHDPTTPEFGIYQKVTLDVYGKCWTCRVVNIQKTYKNLTCKYELKCANKPHYSGWYSGDRIIESVYYLKQEDY